MEYVLGRMVLQYVDQVLQGIRRLDFHLLDIPRTSQTVLISLYLKAAGVNAVCVIEEQEVV